MTALARWYVPIYALVSGVSILGFWIVVLATGRLRALIPAPERARSHAAAELLTGGLLVAAGVAGLASDAARAVALEGLALGALAYALVGSFGLYPRAPRVRAALLLGLGFAVPAIVMLIADA